MRSTAAQPAARRNISFDDRITRIALMRYQDEDAANAFKESGEKFCTCYRSRAQVALPRNKLPTLAEAYKHFTGGGPGGGSPRDAGRPSLRPHLLRFAGSRCGAGQFGAAG